MEDKPEGVDNVETASGESFNDDSDDDDEPSTSGQDDGPQFEVPLTEEEIEELIAEFLEVESKAAEAQESLEEESLAKLETEVREELSQTLQRDDLDTAVADEMATFKEECEAVLDELETESSHLLEQLDCAGVELPGLYKWIESQSPEGCSTEAWRKRTQWVGSQVNSDINKSILDAEKYLQTHRPVRRRHGKLLEEGASGFLAKKFASEDGNDAVTGSSEVDWCSFNKIFSDGVAANDTSFGSKHWASVYLASTPQQAAELGLQFPGLNEVEEIEDVDGNSSDPFIAAAIANEQELDLSEEQRKNFRKVKEEDDAIIHRNLQLHLKQRRHRKRSKPVEDACQKEVSSMPENWAVSACSDDCSVFDSSGKPPPADDADKNDQEVSCSNLKTDTTNSDGPDSEKKLCNGTAPVICEQVLPNLVEPRGFKRLHDGKDIETDDKRIRTAVDSDVEDQVTENNCVSPVHEVTKKDNQSWQENGGASISDGTPHVETIKESFHCTACNKLALEVHRHPLLKVIICKDCKCLMEIKMHMKQDPDCSECYCAWCGRTSDLINCKSCKALFCASCIQRNFGEKCLAGGKTFTWQCCCCSPSLLHRMTLELDKAAGSGVLVVSSSDSDSDSSDSDFNVPVSFKRRRKKKIRRILDDTELGEETKKKIAIEKERQDRLKSLHVNFSAKSTMQSTASYNGISLEGVGVDVLGDALTGYIVNVVREKGEEAVRIPPSISAKLKSHQIAGIRFMWENIVQSIRKVKSGDEGLGCILAHTMGLGKTFQVIAFLYTAMRSVDLGLKTALIVMPVNVLHNWRQEFLKWRPTEFKPLRVYMLEDVSRERRAGLLAKWRAKGGVFLIGYAAFRNLSLGKHVKDRHMAREICYALQEGPDILVCDEAHMIKNTKADTTQALKLVKSQRRIALTGSPLQNNLMEYYCMVDFVREGFLGSSHEFRNRFQNPIENGQHANSTSEDVKIMSQRSHILYEHLKGFVQRMDMNVVKKDLPPKTVFVIAVKLSALQRKLYKRFLDVHGFTRDRASTEKMRKRSFFAGYQALAQIWNHPGILQLSKDVKDFVRREDVLENFLVDDSSSDDNRDYSTAIADKSRNRDELLQRRRNESFFMKDWWNDLLHEKNCNDADYSGKMVLLLDILTMCCDVGDKALVFSQSISTLDLIETYLSKLPRHRNQGKCWKKGKDWYRLDGKTVASERQKLVEMFNEPLNKRVKCALISTKAGSLGINLHSANRVIIVDGSWNPTYDLQAIYRAWRYGQKKPVFAYRLLAHGTMEEKIYKRQVTKEGLAARVVDRQQVYRTMSKEEMLHLFEFGDDENPDISAEADQENGCIINETAIDQKGNCTKQKLEPLHGSCTSDKLMEILLGRQHPRWIANYHEHETLLQENEEEKLSKEEQEMAWEVYRRTLEWEEVQRGAPDNLMFEQKPAVPNAASRAPESQSPTEPKRSLRNFQLVRKCTNLSHMLTLRSQGTKVGCSTICGECAREISWEDLSRDGKSAR